MVRSSKFAALLVLVGCSSSTVDVSPARQSLVTADKLVIRQIYGGGGNLGATLKQDFIELFNAGATTVSLNGLSLQYTAANGMTAFARDANNITVLPDVQLAPGQSYLVAGDVGTSTDATVDLPAPFLTDASPFKLGAKGGRLALVTGAEQLTCKQVACGAAEANCVPCNLDPRVIDLVGVQPGNGVCEGTPTAEASNTIAVLRLEGGCKDTNDNSADFELVSPLPRNQNSPLTPCAVAVQDAGSSEVDASVTPDASVMPDASSESDAGGETDAGRPPIVCPPDIGGERYTCPDGSTVPRTWLCDGMADCNSFTNSADECGCVIDGGEICNDGMDLPDEDWCDGYAQCVDDSDEADCDDHPNGPFRCPDGNTISRAWVCDGQADCNNGTSNADEIGCVGDGGHFCDDGMDVDDDAWCDESVDCIDGSDETDAHCGATGDFVCPGGGTIPRSQVCNGQANCNGRTNAADEAGCVIDNGRLCADGMDVKDLWWCDSDPDCVDHSDEANCPPPEADAGSVERDAGGLEGVDAGHGGDGEGDDAGPDTVKPDASIIPGDGDGDGDGDGAGDGDGDADSDTDEDDTVEDDTETSMDPITDLGEAKKSSSSCAVAGGQREGSESMLAFLTLGLAFVVRRRRTR